jgi:hypothetical protein
MKVLNMRLLFKTLYSPKSNKKVYFLKVMKSFDRHGLGQHPSDLILEHLEKAVKRRKRFYFRILFSAIKCKNFSSVKFLLFAMYVPLRPIGQVNKKLSSNYRQINLENTVIRSIKVIRKVGGGVIWTNHSGCKMIS